MAILPNVMAPSISAPMMLRQLITALTFVAMFCSGSAVASEATGQVIFVAGDASIVRDGQVVGISSGSELQVGDAVLTGPTGLVQIKFSVGDRLALFGNSDLLVERYSARRGTRHYRLRAGAVRSITGIVRAIEGTGGIEGTGYIEHAGEIEGTGYIEGTGGIEGTGAIEGTGRRLAEGIEGTGRSMAAIEGTGEGINGTGSTVAGIDGTGKGIGGTGARMAEGQYRMYTPYGNVRVYGTDYTIVICEHDKRADLGSGECSLPVIDPQQPNQARKVLALPGLYAAVNGGSIGLEAQRRELRLRVGSFAVQDGIEGTGRRLAVAPAIFAELAAQASSGVAVSNNEATPEDSNAGSIELPGPQQITSLVAPPQIVSPPVGMQMTRSLAIGFGNFAGAGSAVIEDITEDANSDLRGLTLDQRRYQIGSASNMDPPAVPPRGGNGLIWGRWSGGDAVVTNSQGGDSTINLVDGSLHWITGPATELGPISLPTSGTATYSQFGATTPTDNDGNVGLVTDSSFSITFGSAFGSRVNTSVTAEFGDGGDRWVASGGEGIIRPASSGGHLVFQGEYASTVVTGAEGTRMPEGSRFSGILTNPAGAGEAPPAAGLIYQLGQSGDRPRVNGAVLFELDN